MSDIRKKKVLGIITQPVEKSGVTSLGSLIELLQNFTEKIFLITGNEGSI